MLHQKAVLDHVAKARKFRKGSEGRAVHAKAALAHDRARDAYDTALSIHAGIRKGDLGKSSEAARKLSDAANAQSKKAESLGVDGRKAATTKVVAPANIKSARIATSLRNRRFPVRHWDE